MGVGGKVGSIAAEARVGIEGPARTDWGRSSAAVPRAPERAQAISPLVDRITDIQSDAEFILLVEKDAAFIRLSEDRFYNTYPCIIITVRATAVPPPVRASGLTPTTV